MSKTVGFIGLGNMGSGMARNLAKAGIELVGFDSDTEKTNIEGVKQAKDIAEVAKDCETVILCLPNPDVSREVISKLLSSGVEMIIETSTLTPEIVTEFTKMIADTGKKLLSTPMVGGKNHAAKGTIEFLVEGDKEDFDNNLPYFEAMGKARYMGKVPSATLAKLTFNLCRYANLAVAVEAYRLLQKYGANTTAIHEFVSEQSLDNFGQVWAEDMKDMMTSDIPFQPSQVPKKDLAMMAEMAEDNNIDPEIIKAVRNMYLSME